MINSLTINWKGWRTLAAAAGVAALGVIQTYLQKNGGGLIPVAYIGPVIVAIGFIMAYLRSITDTSMMTK